MAAADKAIDAGSVDELAKKIGQAAEKGVKERFERLMKAKKHKEEYVEAYVIFVHYVEGLHNTIMAGGAHHGQEGGAHGEEGEGHGH